MMNHLDRLQRVTSYIHDHLDDELDLNRIAEVACLSPHHWHRIYHAVHGETVVASVKRQRLHRAAGFLAHTTMPVAAIAKRSGYPNVQSFTRIFSAVYGMPPARYRTEGTHTQFITPTTEASDIMYPVEIRSIASMRVVKVDHVGSYMLIGKAFEQLYGWLAAHRHIGSVSRSIGIFLDDTTIVSEDALRSMACVTLNSEVNVAPPLGYAEIAGGDHAVLRHTGPYADMKAAYGWLYGTWLPQSGHEAADAPAFEEYMNNPRDTAPADLVTDIHLPLRGVRA